MLRDDIFSRTRLLVGEDRFAKFAGARVAVFGVGGVGGWCVEALARSGVGSFMLVDSDTVAPSNINRQVMATTSTIGRPKVDVLADRLRAINPDISLELRHERYTPQTKDAFNLASYDIVIDAIDSLDCKASLIRHALQCENVTLLSSMGAARKFDISAIRATPFRKVEGDRLAKALRRIFKSTGGLPTKDFTCVWSPEQLQNAFDPPPEEKRANGTLMHITAAFGLKLAQLALKSAER